ncbi:HAD family phosphatase, partial [Vibrio parahaemolyticus]|nr:HAD family phosphatase [Vibrio parahaemolyticus]
MNSVQIKNVIFDVGNVLVRWSPVEIVRLTFGGSVESEKMAQMLFSSQIWKDLNKGTISEREAKQRYQREHQVTTEEMGRFFYY